MRLPVADGWLISPDRCCLSRHSHRSIGMTYPRCRARRRYLSLRRGRMWNWKTTARIYCCLRAGDCTIRRNGFCSAVVIVSAKRNRTGRILYVGSFDRVTSNTRGCVETNCSTQPLVYSENPHSIRKRRIRISGLLSNRCSASIA